MADLQAPKRMKTEQDGGAAAAGPTENAATDELAMALALDQEEQAGSPAPSAEQETIESVAEGDASPESEEPTAAAEETEAEGDSEVLSQPEETTEDKELTAEVGEVPKLSEAQKQHVSQIIRDRIGKATAKLKAAEDEAAQLKTQLEETQKQLAERPEPAPMESENDPMAAVTTEDALREKVRLNNQVLDFCEENLVRVKRNPELVTQRLKELGVKLTDGNGEEDYSRDAIESFLEEKRLQASRVLSREVPKREQFLKAKRAAETEMQSKLPWLKDAKNPKTAKYQELIRANPAVSRFAAGHYLVALAVEGAARLDAEAAARKNPPVTTPKPPAKPVAGAVAKTKAAPSKPQGRPSRVAQAEKDFMETQSVNDLARSLDIY